MGPPLRIDPTTHRIMSEHSYHGATSRSHLLNAIDNFCNDNDINDDCAVMMTALQMTVMTLPANHG